MCRRLQTRIQLAKLGSALADEHARLLSCIPGGAGAIVSTASDLVKFIHALFDGKLISQENVNTMKSGMGMSDLKIGDITFYGHAGSMVSFRSMLLYLPE